MASSIYAPSPACAHVIQSRLLAHDVGRGELVRRPELIRKQAEIDEDLKALAEAEREVGAGLNTASLFAVLQEDWRFLKETIASLTPEDADALHASLLADVAALTSHVGDASNLILDPYLDSYYLMDPILLPLPEGEDLAGRTAMLGKKCLRPGATLTAEQRAEFIRLSGLLRSNLNTTRLRHGQGISEQCRRASPGPPGPTATRVRHRDGTGAATPRSANPSGECDRRVARRLGAADRRATPNQLPAVEPDERGAGHCTEGAHRGLLRQNASGAGMRSGPYCWPSTC